MKVIDSIASSETFTEYPKGERKAVIRRNSTKVLFPAYFSACQDLASVVLDGTEARELPPIFARLRTQEEAGSTRKKMPDIDGVIERHSAELFARGAYGEQNLVNWKLAAPLIAEEVARHA